MPSVSVLVPNYNHAAFLEKRLTTVLNQSFHDIEVFVLDDASTDRSREIIAQYSGDARVRVDIRTTNSGSPTAQWNRGVKMASGEYIWIAESDDYAHTDLLQTLVEILNQHPDVGLAYCESTVVDKADCHIRSAAHWSTKVDPDRWTRPFVNCGRDECARFFVIQNLIPNASAVVFRRHLYEEVGGADESYTMAGDYELWVRMLLRSSVAFTPEPFNFFRDHENNVRSKYNSSCKFLVEDYDILDMIRQQVSVPAESLHLAHDRRLNEWAYRHLIRQPRINWRINWHIYRRARRSDPAIHRRLAKYWHSHLRRVKPHPNRFHA